ncbi:hypothetical protein ACIPRI_06590 [Variovorax sp. LARHSF232]
MKLDSRKTSLMVALVLSLGGGAALAQKPEKPVDTGQMANSREEVRAEARAAVRNTANTPVPSAAGEASTMTNNQPNMQTLPSVEASRADVRQGLFASRPRFGETGERSTVPTNPDGKVATPD